MKRRPKKSHSSFIAATKNAVAGKPRREIREGSPSVASPPVRGGEKLLSKEIPKSIRTRQAPRHVPVVGVGASAGGLEAFTELLQHLPTNTGMGFVLVQHLDPEHESALVQLLSRVTPMPVIEVTDGLRVEANRIYIIPKNKLMSITGGQLRLKPRSKDRTPARSIDLFLESLAQDQRERGIGIILSGTATDGTLGLEAIKSEGGITFAQDGSAKYDSMPRSAVGAGCVDFELSPKKIARELTRIAAHPFVAGTADGDGDAPLPSDGQDNPDGASLPAAAEAGSGQSDGLREDGVRKILLLVRNHTGVDFSLYKSATILRRIARRMVLNQLDTHIAYAGFLRGNTAELDALFSDLLISVTSFFRNPEAFALLQRKVFPKIFDRRSDQPVRVWVLGCSTGQEAYSLAMALMESAGTSTGVRKIQVFATDLNEALLEKARAGLYAKSLAQDISRERLRRFFTEEEGGYRATKELRQSVVFARQNVLSDPPFSRMDLVSCRNLLIYFDQGWQKKILPMFHYALNPEGILFLGASESVAGFTELFDPIDKKHKLFAKRPAHTPALTMPAGGRDVRPDKTHMPLRAAIPSKDVPGTELTAQREADRLTVNQFAPPGVLVNDALQILQFRGPTSAYLEPPLGNASFDVLKMAREGLMLPLRAAINKARRDGKPVRKEHVSLKQTGGARLVTLQITPLKNLKERCFLVLFEDEGKDGGSSAQRVRAQQPGPDPADRRISKRDESRHIRVLTDELAETRDYLQSIQEQHEAAGEELQAANEEVTSANEELQSINEELETSKEELESANEELITVNEEMANRNSELNRLNADLNNLHVSINTAIVVLGRDLKIRRFTAAAEKVFNLLGSDLGRSLSGIRHNLSFQPPASDGSGPAETNGNLPSTLEDIVREVIDTVSVRTCEVRDRSGRWYSLCVRPYITLDRKIDGAVLVLEDIDVLKRSEQDAKAARNYAERILRTARTPLLVLRPDLRVNTANAAFYRTFRTTPAKTEGLSLWELGGSQWKIPRLRELLEEVLPRDSFFDGFEMTQDFSGLGVRTVVLDARRLDTEVDGPQLILLAIEDVTEKHRLDDSIRRSEERFRALTEASAQIVWTADANGLVSEDSPSWRAFTGQTSEQWRGLGGLAVVHPDDRARVKKTWLESNAAKSRYEIEYRLRRSDGTYCWMAVRGVPVMEADGSVREWIGTNTDITVMREKAIELARARDEAVAASRAKDEFIAALSHELRTPLNPVLLVASDGAANEDLSDEVRADFKTISKNISLEALLIDDLLDLTRISRGTLKVDMQPCDAHAVMGDAIAVVRSDIDEKGISLSVDLGAERANVMGDPLRLQQIFWNVLRNAVHFTPKAGTITVKSRLSSAGDELVVTITDTGIGIGREDLMRIFQAFVQGDAVPGAPRKSGGLGLGLAISQKLVELHAGSITANSPGRGGGSTFAVSVPLIATTGKKKASPAGEVGIDSRGPARSKGPQAPRGRILIVDDHVPTIAVLTRIIRRWNFEVHTAVSVTEALKIAGQHALEFVVSDIGLPDGDGYSLMAQLRAIHPDLLGIALSGYGGESDLAKSHEAGFAEHLTKPVKTENLERALRNLGNSRTAAQ